MKDHFISGYFARAAAFKPLITAVICASAPTKFVPLSVMMVVGRGRRARKREKANKKASVVRWWTTSM